MAWILLDNIDPIGNRKPKQNDLESVPFNQMIRRLNIESKENIISKEPGTIEKKLINLYHHRQLEDILGINRTPTHTER